MNLKDLFAKIISRVLYPIVPYWTANIYGFGKWIRRYGYYPPCLPLCIYTDHGPGDSINVPAPHELSSDAPVQFYHAKTAVEKWGQVSNKSCHVLHSPFVFARKILGFNYNREAKGTIYFVAHGTPSVSENKKPTRYHEEIQALPVKYHPVTICLHIHDVKIGLDKIYEDLGYKVVSAGDSLNQNFTENFYKLVTQYKYALSNIFGSYGLYTVEMGMPFGLYGSEPEYINESDPNIESGTYNSYKQGAYYEQVLALFNTLPSEEISIEQRVFVENYLGLNHGLSRKEMALVLYKSLFLWLGSKLKLGGK